MVQSVASRRRQSALLPPREQGAGLEAQPTFHNMFRRERVRGLGFSYPDIMAFFSVPRSLGRKTRAKLIQNFIHVQLRIHILNRRLRMGIAQLPWVRGDPETVQGHTGSGSFIIMHLRVLGLLPLDLASTLYLALMFYSHELDEVEKGDVTLWTFEEKLERTKYYTLEQWMSRRRSEYFEEGGEEKVRSFILATCLDEDEIVVDDFGILIEQQNAEFANGLSRLARIAQQVDVLQAVFEAASRAYFSGEPDHLIVGGQVVGPWWNYRDYYRQAVLLLDSSLFVDILEALDNIMQERQRRILNQVEVA